MNEPRDFNELVSWATWQVIEGMTRGEPLKKVIHYVLQSTLLMMSEWKDKK